MSRTRTVIKWAGIVLISLLTALTLSLLFIVIYTFTNKETAENHQTSFSALTAELAQTASGYGLSAKGETLLKSNDEFAFVIGSNGKVIWAFDKPEDVPDSFIPAQVAVFSKWYLGSYPVRTYVYGMADQDLLVIGSRRTDLVKYNWTWSITSLTRLIAGIPVLAVVIFLTLLLITRSVERREQKRRDEARAQWINGISHDIRTPLSLVMGYAEEWQEDPSLPAEKRKEAARMVSACGSVKSLVEDLNLTMRMDYEMQPLRREMIHLLPIVREAATDLMNSGAVTELELMPEPNISNITVNADSALLRRAIINLIVNADRCKTGGIVIIRLESSGNHASIIVRNEAAGLSKEALKALNRDRPPAGSTDGSAMHGTGLHLVHQIASAHGGTLTFRYTENTEILEAILTIKR